MAVTLAKMCAACNKKHTFYLPNCQRPDPLGRYSYLCEETGDTVPLHMTILPWWILVQNKPEGAIEVHEMG